MLNRSEDIWQALLFAKSELERLQREAAAAPDNRELRSSLQTAQDWVADLVEVWNAHCNCHWRSV